MRVQVSRICLRSMFNNTKAEVTVPQWGNLQAWNQHALPMPHNTTSCHPIHLEFSSCPPLTHKRGKGGICWLGASGSTLLGGHRTSSNNQKLAKNTTLGARTSTSQHTWVLRRVFSNWTSRTLLRSHQMWLAKTHPWYLIPYSLFRICWATWIVSILSGLENMKKYPVSNSRIFQAVFNWAAETPLYLWLTFLQFLA